MNSHDYDWKLEDDAWHEEWSSLLPPDLEPFRASLSHMELAAMALLRTWMPATPRWASRELLWFDDSLKEKLSICMYLACPIVFGLESV